MVNKKSYEGGFKLKIKKSVAYYSTGNIWNILWHKEGDIGYLHKENGPACIWYYDTGKLSYEAWWVENKRHKIDGPACIDYDEDGTIIDKEYYINGENLTKEQWQEYLIKEAMKEALK